MLNRLADTTQSAVESAYALYEGGAITKAEFVDLAAMLVETARIQGANAANVVLRAYVETATGTANAVVGIAAASASERMKTAMATILASDQDTLMQLARLAANEPVQAATEAFHDAMQGLPSVSGWRRGLETGATCQLCTWWWRDGRIWRKEHPMPRHTGCRCHQIPVVKEKTINFQTENQARAIARHR